MAANPRDAAAALAMDAVIRAVTHYECGWCHPGNRFALCARHSDEAWWALAKIAPRPEQPR